MIFEALSESNERGELILIDGGYCRFHLRRDGQLTILEILSQKPGCGQAMLERLRLVSGAKCIFAKCPKDLKANEWYAKRGFECVGNEATKSGRWLRKWRLQL